MQLISDEYLMAGCSRQNHTSSIQTCFHCVFVNNCNMNVVGFEITV